MARFEDNDVWLTQKQLADLFNTTKQNVSQHLKTIYESEELLEASTVKKFFTMDENAGQVQKGQLCTITLMPLSLLAIA